MTSIDDATPEEWDEIAKKFDKTFKTDGQLVREAKHKTKQIDNGPKFIENCFTLHKTQDCTQCCHSQY